MKLSEAIRLGAMLRPQLHGGMYSLRDVAVPGDVLGLRRERVASCALGAAYEAVSAGRRMVPSTGESRPFRGDAVAAGEMIEIIDTPHEWRVLFITVACPMCAAVEQVLRTIPHLNDDHIWTREQIADWVATIEPQDAPAEEPQPVAVVEARSE